MAIPRIAEKGAMILDVLDGTKKGMDLISRTLRMLAGNWLEVNDAAFKTARTMALGRDQALQYNEQLLQSTKKLAAQFGITAKELADFQKTYAESVGRNVILSQQQLAHMSALSKIAGESASKLIDEYDKVGVGIARATAYTGRLQERAKALGVSPAKATKMMADNIKLAASYSFRNGVNDIEKMSLKAASMRMDMSAVMSATEKFADIESAIGTSANIQMLGGSFAREFSNPMGAMYEAMADPAAFQERILRTIEGKGTYDEKTGAVTFDPITMRMMREVSKQLGMSAEQLNTSAMASVQNQRVEDELKKAGNFNNWSPKDLEAIKNLSRTNVDEETGKHYVTLLEDGKEKQVNIEELTKDQLAIAKDSQMTEEGLWNDVADIKTILERVHGRARETTSAKEDLEGASTWWQTFKANWADIILEPLSNLGNKFVNNALSTQFFSEGGIAKPLHAAVGTIVPGDAYSGDKVPAMLNSGEMVLNPVQQKSMFSLISSLAVNGGMMYGMNKLGGKMGVGGLGSTMMLANMIGGDNVGVTDFVEAHFLKKFVKKLIPFKKGIEGVDKTTQAATKSTSVFSARFKELTDAITRDWNSITSKLSDSLHRFGRRVSVTTRRFFTTGRLGKVTSGVNTVATYIGGKSRQFGSLIAKYAKTIGETVGKYTVKPISTGFSKGWGWLKSSKLGTATQTRIGNAQLGLVRARLGLKDFSDKVIKPKTKEYSSLVRNLFNGGSKAQASKAASRAVTEVAAKETSIAAKATTKLPKLMSGLGKVGKSLAPATKFLAKKIPVIGNVLAVGGAVSGMMGASSQYDAKIDEIESSHMTDLDKAKAKDRATKEKNASYGSSIGSVAGTAIGGALGGAIGGPLGAMAGMWLGEKAGNFIGKGIGGLFGGNNEKKLKEEQKKAEKLEIKSNDDAVKVLSSIDNKMSILTGKKVGLSGKTLASPTLSPIDVMKKAAGGISVLGGLLPPVAIARLIGKTSIGKSIKDKISSSIEGLPITGNFMKVSPNKETGTGANRPMSIGKTDINLNVSGTIKLEGGGNSTNLDLSKLINTPEFKRQIADIITRRINESSNSGKRNMESERNNMAEQYNRSGK